jgi:hypothetical protein
MNTYAVNGRNAYAAAEISGRGTTGELVVYLQVPEGAPALYASLGDPLTGRLPAAEGFAFAVSGPDGTVYRNANTSTLFATSDGPLLTALALLNP